LKKFLLLFVISFSFFSCSPETNTIIENVCDITQEICYYANLICNNYNPATDAPIIDEKKMSELKLYAADLKSIYTSTQFPNKASAPLSNKMVNDKLIEIRDQLKRIYEQQTILRH